MKKDDRGQQKALYQTGLTEIVQATSPSMEKIFEDLRTDKCLNNFVHDIDKDLDDIVPGEALFQVFHTDSPNVRQGLAELSSQKLATLDLKARLVHSRRNLVRAVLETLLDLECLDVRANDFLPPSSFEGPARLPEKAA